MPIGASTIASVAGTGGSKDAIVVSHTHTAVTSINDPGHSHNYLGVINPSGSASGERMSVPLTRTTDPAFTGITASTSISTEGSSGTNANLPPYLGINFIIKT
jgi:microcystin-dependent protein